MKILLLIIFTLIISIPSALGLVLSEEGTGLTQNFIVQTGGYDFPVKVTGNLDVQDLSLDKDTKTITMSISSSLDENIMEILIPQNLINGEFTFFLDSVEVFPQVALLTDNAFITLEFEGEGMHTLDILSLIHI